jgi:hypothetical protein
MPSSTKTWWRIEHRTTAGLQYHNRHGSVASQKSTRYSLPVTRAPAIPIETDNIESVASQPGEVVRAHTRTRLVEEEESLLEQAAAEPKRVERPKKSPTLLRNPSFCPR